MNFTGILHLLLNYSYFVDNIAREVESDREASQGLVVVAQLVDEAVERVGTDWVHKAASSPFRPHC